MNLCTSAVPFCCAQISKHAKLDRKPVDDVLGGEEAWKNVQKTDGKQRDAVSWWQPGRRLASIGGV